MSLNTWKLHWISESKMNTRNSYYNKRKKMDKLDETGGGKLDENRGEGKLGEPRMDKRGKWQEVACSEVECWRAGNELPGK